jgi:hypothetical protein
MGRILKKACTDLHNQKIVISSARKSPKIDYNKSYQRIIAYIERLEKLFLMMNMTIMLMKDYDKIFLN